MASDVRRRGRVTSRIAVLLFAGSLVLVGFPSQAWAGDVIHVCPDEVQFDWNFTNDQGYEDKVWTTTLKNRFETAFADWESVDRWQGGGSYVSRGGRVWDVKWQDFGNTTEFARMECLPWPVSEWNIFFNSRLYDEFAANIISMRGVATHEIGHTLGIAHSGIGWGKGFGPPTMATCEADTFEQRWLSKDDSAMLTLQNDKVGNFGSVTANPSFEEEDVDKWWALNKVGAWQQLPGGVDGSDYYLSFRGALPGEYTTIKQVVRLGIQPRLNDHTSVVKTRINHKKVNAQDSGTVTAKLQVQQAPHFEVSGSCEEDAFYVLSWNDPGTVSGWQWKYSRTFTPVTSWACGHPESMPACDDVPSNGHTITDNSAWDLKVVVVNHMTTQSGGAAFLGVDRARVLYDS